MPNARKNLCAKTRKADDPYEIWTTPDGSWTWYVLKKWQVDDWELKASWSVVHAHWRRHRWKNNGTVLMGDGRLETDQTRLAAGHVELRAGELVWLDGRTPRKVLGEQFVAAWCALAAPPTSVTAKILMADAGLYDTPQEVMLDHAVATIRRGLSWFFAPVSICGDLFGPPREEPWRTLNLSLVADRGRSKASHNMELPEYLGPLLFGCELFLAGQNLLAPDHWTKAPCLGISLGDLWTWASQQQQLVTIKAQRLRDEVAKQYGFVRIEWKEGLSAHAWLRGEKCTDSWSGRRLSAWQGTGKEHVIITDTGKVYVNGIFRCVVEGKVATLPPEDQVVRRMLSVATTHRERIVTLKDDLPVLERLFADYKDARVFEHVMKGAET